MNQAEYCRLREQVDADYKKNREALDRLWRMSNETPPPSMSGNTAVAPAALAAGQRQQEPNKLPAAVEIAVGSCSSPFTVKDVAAALGEQHPDLVAKNSSISHVLRRLVRNGKLELVEIGKGKRPSMYKTLTEPAD